MAVGCCEGQQWRIQKRRIVSTLGVTVSRERKTKREKKQTNKLGTLSSNSPLDNERSVLSIFIGNGRLRIALQESAGPGPGAPNRFLTERHRWSGNGASTLRILRQEAKRNFFHNKSSWFGGGGALKRNRFLTERQRWSGNGASTLRILRQEEKRNFFHKKKDGSGEGGGSWNVTGS